MRASGLERRMRTRIKKESPGGRGKKSQTGRYERWRFATRKRRDKGERKCSYMAKKLKVG